PKSGTSWDRDEKPLKAVANKEGSKITRQGDSSGGGRSTISKNTPVDSKAARNKTAMGLMNPEKGNGNPRTAPKANQKRGSY
ncbi:hypothetical protein SB816_33935, partial [Achromobacter sp. SIMBA_011]